MKLLWRQKIGIAMIGIPVVAAMAVQALTGEPVHVRHLEPPNSGEVFVIDGHLSWRYALPLGSCAACGFALALLPPTRRRAAP